MVSLSWTCYIPFKVYNKFILLQSCCHALYTVICNVWYSCNCSSCVMLEIHVQRSKIRMMLSGEVYRRKWKGQQLPEIESRTLLVLPSCSLVPRLLFRRARKMRSGNETSHLMLCHWATINGQPLATQSFTCTAQVILNAAVTHLHGSHSAHAFRNLQPENSPSARAE